MNKDFSGSNETMYSTELIGIGKLSKILMQSMITNCKYFTFVITAE